MTPFRLSSTLQIRFKVITNSHVIEMSKYFGTTALHVYSTVCVTFIFAPVLVTHYHLVSVSWHSPTKLPTKCFDSLTVTFFLSLLLGGGDCFTI